MLLAFALVLMQFKPASPEAPLKQPQLASGNGTVALAYGSGKKIFVATSKDGGSTFSDPTMVASVDVLPLGRHRGPRIAITGNTIIVTAVAGEKVATGPHAHGLPEDGNLYVWRSNDGGKSWSGNSQINDVPRSAREGLHALATDGKGHVFAAWLDLRKPGTSIYGSWSNDAGITWLKNIAVYESPEKTVCECCHPSIAMGSDGTIWVMWRNSLAGSRDMYVATSKDGKHFENAVKLGQGTWPLNACPMDGGGLTATPTGVVSAWRRDTDIYLSQPGKSETKIGSGKDVALTWTKSGTVAVWSKGPALQFLKAGQESPHILSEEGAFPVIQAISGDSALAAWEEKGGIALRAIP